MWRLYGHFAEKINAFLCRPRDNKVDKLNSNHGLTILEEYNEIEGSSPTVSFMKLEHKLIDCVTYVEL